MVLLTGVALLVVLAVLAIVVAVGVLLFFLVRASSRPRR